MYTHFQFKVDRSITRFVMSYVPAISKNVVPRKIRMQTVAVFKEFFCSSSLILCLFAGMAGELARAELCGTHRCYSNYRKM